MAGFDASGIDEAIHGRMRLGVMAHLSQANPATFTELAAALGATNGNLSVHLTKLEEAGYVALDRKKGGQAKGGQAEGKQAKGAGRPATLVSLTDEGRAAWASYLDMLRALF